MLGGLAGPCVYATERQMGPLQDQALLAFTALSCQQSGTGGTFEDFADSLVGLGRALKVFVGSDLLADFLTLEITVSAVPI